MNLAPRTFSPAHQPDQAAPVTFQLRPLDMATMYELQRSQNDDGVPSFAGASAAFAYSVVGWSGATFDGEPIEYSPQARQKILRGALEMNWLVWIVQVAGELYRSAQLPESERKNS